MAENKIGDTMKNILGMVSAVICIMSASPLLGQQPVKRVGEVKYISQQSYYINIGTKQGLKAGDILNVRRNNRLIGRLIVENVAKHSSACRLLNQTSIIKKGDRAEVFVQVVTNEAKEEKPERLENKKPDSMAKPSGKNGNYSKKKKRPSSNRVKGRVSIQSVWLDDKSSFNSDYQQFGLRSKLSVDKFLGLPFQLRFRWRSRAHHREKVLSSAVSNNEFTHSLYELGLVYQNGNSPFELGLGRILSREIRGLGYIDGGLFSYRMNGHWRVGVAGGTQPGLRNSAFQTNEQKFGLFVNFEKGDYQTQRLSSAIAFSGSYHGGKTSREFVYLQNNFGIGSTFSVYQTVEIDFNRGWKYDYAKKNVQFSNLYFSTRYTPADFISLNISYDARKAVRVFETRSIPDSLFDETTRQGFRSGVTLRLPHRIRLSGSFGIRLRQGGLRNTTSASGGLTVRQIFNTWATFNARLSYFSTMFTKGYRPNMTMRFPITRGLAINVGGGSYIYQTGNQTNYNNWLEANGYYRINRRLFANFGYRIFIDERLKSGRFFVESGVVF